jgi:hypothetical protein
MRKRAIEIKAAMLIVDCRLQGHRIRQVERISQVER